MKKYALIGGPSSGKSSVIKEAKNRGILILTEVARDVIGAWGYFPTLPAEIETIQQEIFFSQINRERELEDKGSFALLDRGALDALAYSKYYLGRIPYDYSNYNLNSRYDGVFLLERAPYQADGLRIEGSDEVARIIHERIVETYEQYGYKLINIPLVEDFSRAPKERLDMILKEIENDNRNRSQN